MLPLLTDPGAHGADPGDAFDVVVPDMPGFGHSDRPAGAPLDSIAVAGLWAVPTSRLGYAQFGVAGGDIGSSVSRYLALDNPARVVAVHRMKANMPVDTGGDYTPEERAWLDAAAAWKGDEGAYAEMHRTKPQTAAIGLTDSPALPGVLGVGNGEIRGLSSVDEEVVMPAGSSPKRERQYEHIKDSAEKRGVPGKRATEIAARTVNKERARAGESQTASRSSTRDVSSSHRGGKRSHSVAQGRTKEQLYNEAKKRNIKGRSSMSKAQLEHALAR